MQNPKNDDPTVPAAQNTTSLSYQNDTNYPPKRKWAYAFLIGGCNSRKPDHRGFLYNVAVAAHILRERGSVADFVLLVQMSYATNETALPDDEINLLSSVGVRVVYLPKFAARVHEKFYGLVMEKFRVLELTDYSRVLFLDSDIMPFCSFDYLFELSEPAEGKALLKENVVMAWREEPCNAGLFMLQPSKGDFAMVQDIIVKKEKKALNLSWPYWDPVEGWGHKIEDWDAWKSPDGITGTNWTWHASFADQGLLYYWTKYVKQSVSLIIKSKVENWGRSQDGTLVLEKAYPKGTLRNYTCVRPVRGGGQNGYSPYRDFKHFTGKSKPWQKNLTTIEKYMSREGVPIKREDKWYHALKTVSQNAKVPLNFSFAVKTGTRDPPIGRFSDFPTMIRHISAKAARNWTAYA